MEKDKISAFGMIGLVMLCLLDMLVTSVKPFILQATLKLISFSSIFYLIIFLVIPAVRRFNFPVEIEMPLLIGSILLLSFFAWILFLKDLSELLDKHEHKLAQEKLSGKI